MTSLGPSSCLMLCRMLSSASSCACLKLFTQMASAARPLHTAAATQMAATTLVHAYGIRCHCSWLRDMACKPQELTLSCQDVVNPADVLAWCWCSPAAMGVVLTHCIAPHV